MPFMRRMIIYFLLFGNVQFSLSEESIMAAAAQKCKKNFVISSAYFAVSVDGFVKVFFATAHKLWNSDSPYQSPRCVFEHLSYRDEKKISTASVNMSTQRHHSQCELLVELSVGNSQTHLSFRVEDGNETVCTVNATRLIPRENQPVYNLMGVSMARNPLYLREWLNYHFAHIFQHIVIYDDGSDVPIQNLVPDFIDQGRVTVVNWSHMSFHNARQFTAIQDFLYRFSALSTWIVYLDNDWYFPESGPNGMALIRILDESMQRNITQLTVLSSWHGACTTPASIQLLLNASVNVSVSACFPTEDERATLCPVLDSGDLPPHLLFSGHNGRIAPTVTIPNVTGSRALMTTASFARPHAVQLLASLAHVWGSEKCQGCLQHRTSILNSSSYRFRHFKLLDYRRHQQKQQNSGGWWSSKFGGEGLDNWLVKNKALCQVRPCSTSSPPAHITRATRFAILYRA